MSQSELETPIIITIAIAVPPSVSFYVEMKWVNYSQDFLCQHVLHCIYLQIVSCHAIRTLLKEMDK